MIGYRGGRFQRALDDAKAAGFLCEVTRRYDQARVIEIRSVLRVARALGIDSIGGCPVEVKVSSLAKLADWRAALLAAWHTGKSKKSNPIAQYTIRALTGVPERTQYNYNKRAGMDVRENIAISSNPPSDTVALFEAAENHANVFTLKDQASGKKYIAWSIPATYTSPLSRTARGSTRKINTALKGALFISQRGSTYERLFWDDANQCAKKVGRDLEVLGNGEKRSDAPRDRYYFKGIDPRLQRGIYGVL